MPNYIRAKIKNQEILIAVEPTVEIIEQQSTTKKQIKQKGLKTVETSFREKVTDKIQDVKKEIKNLIVDLGNDLNGVKDNISAKSLELEFKIGFTAEGKLIVGAKAEGSISVKIIWEN